MYKQEFSQGPQFLPSEGRDYYGPITESQYREGLDRIWIADRHYASSSLDNGASVVLAMPKYVWFYLLNNSKDNRITSKSLNELGFIEDLAKRFTEEEELLLFLRDSPSLDIGLTGKHNKFRFVSMSTTYGTRSKKDIQ